jgi:hypothetical protein
MATSYGHKIVTDGLKLLFDSSNIKSYKGGRTLINWNTWTAGSGSVTGYGCNGDAAENVRSLQTDPWGNTNMVWGTFPDAVSGPDGGWVTSYVAIDNTKLYRHSVWVRRISDTTSGTCYFGLYTNGTGSTVVIPTGATQTNPYWDYRNIGSFTKNTWYLLVGHIFPYNSTTITKHNDSGIYTVASGKVANNVGNVPNDVKFPSNATTMANRCYHYYCTDVTSKIEFFQPRIDCVDGTEPSISELLAGAGSYIYDLSGNGNTGTLVNGVGYSTDNCGCLTFDGVDDYITLPNDIGYTTAFSVFAWFKKVGSPTGGYHIICGPSYLEISTSSGEARIGVQTSTGRSVTNFGSGLTDGNWHQVCFTYNGSTKTAYIDAVFVGSDGVTGTLTYSFGGRTIGSYGGVNYFANGYITSYMVYNKALSTTEISQNYNATKGRYGL